MTSDEYNQMAVIYIRDYLNKDFSDDEINTKYSLAIKRLSARLQELDELPNGISSFKKGEENIGYSTKNIMSDDIKRLLPKPFLKYI